MMMSYTESSLHVEIQNLKDALAASEKNVDRYARMGTTSFIRFAESNSPSDRSQSQHFLSSWTTCETLYVIPARRN